MKNVTTTITDGILKIKAPYSATFVDEIKKLGGRWKSPYWVVDARQEDRARAVLMAAYGEDGTDVPPVIVNIRLTGYQWQREESSVSSDKWIICGRVIAYRRRRDESVKLGFGVVAVDADFSKSGGSAKYPEVSCRTENPVFEVYDIPAVIYERVKDVPGVELLQDKADGDDRVAKLKEERERLLARIAEIDAELSQ